MINYKPTVMGVLIESSSELNPDQTNFAEVINPTAAKKKLIEKLSNEPPPVPSAGKKVPVVLAKSTLDKQRGVDKKPNGFKQTSVDGVLAETWTEEDDSLR